MASVQLTKRERERLNAAMRADSLDDSDHPARPVTATSFHDQATAILLDRGETNFRRETLRLIVPHGHLAFERVSVNGSTSHE